MFPTGEIEKAFKGDNDGGSANQLKMVRLARLPRLYRMVRLLRMLKMLRVFRKSGSIKEWLKEMNISAGMVRLANILVVQSVLVHLMTCFWYLAASFEDDIWTTWVGAKGIVNESVSYKYLTSFFWAF